jgi:eukaryotic-like serine/threonine-protein kinase
MAMELPTFKGWETIEKLGEGGMCAVFRGRSLSDSTQDRAIKVLYDNAPNAVERFIDEARLLNEIEHKNVIKVDHIESEERPPWIVMQMLAGYDLEEGREEGAMQPTRAAEIFADVANGLATVHSMGVRHRDIKPANIMMSHDGVAHLIDFGIARDTSKAHLTQQGFVVGTASYLPPEIFIEDDPGAIQDSEQADVYALGQSLCEVLSGSAVHSREGAGTTQMVAIIKDKMDRPHLDPREWRPGVPDALAEIVIAATMQEPAERISTAIEFEERLRQWLAERGSTEAAPVSRNIDPNMLAVPGPPPKPKPGTIIDQLKPVGRQGVPLGPRPPPPPKQFTPTPPPVVKRPAEPPKEPVLQPPPTPAPVRQASAPVPPPPDFEPPPKRGILGLLMSVGGMATIATVLVVLTGAGVLLLWLFRPVAASLNPDDAVAVHQTVADNKAKFSACKAEKPSKTVLEWTVEAGKAKDIRIVEPSGNGKLDECLGQTIAKLTFPKSSKLTVRLPFDVH